MWRWVIKSHHFWVMKYRLLALPFHKKCAQDVRIALLGGGLYAAPTQCEAGLQQSLGRKANREMAFSFCWLLTAYSL